MSTDPRARILQVLDAVLDAEPAERLTVLDTLCGDDHGLRKEVERLLALEDDTDGFLGEPVLDHAATTVPTSGGLAGDDEAAAPGDRIGPYRIVALLAEGGMGAVYRAVREDDFSKPVAVKLIRRRIHGASAQRRFHAERQILAHLEHPAIARLLDGGTTEDGRPFLVMELVEGYPLTTYADDNQLDLRQRLELFLQLLAAVAYAHQHLVVHRDLKPSNILVTAEGELKLLDFGIAKPLEPMDLLGDESLTGSAESPLTPRYASPEQIRGKNITTTSDVYSLGVLLYRLLTGRLPYQLEHCNAFETAQRICNEEPERPSEVLSEPPPNPRQERARRQLRRSLAGDVDAIVLKALRKEPEERYASVEQLADDLRRYLEGLPVRARRGAWTYRTGKLLRRHKGFVMAALLVTGLGLGATWQWRKAESERFRADYERTEAVAERRRAERVSEFLQEIFRAASPDRAQGRQPTVEELLDTGRERLTSGLAGDDLRTTAELVGTLGNVYRSLGLYDKALEQLEQSVALRRQLHPQGHADLTLALNNLASVYYYLGRYEEAARRFREVLEERERLEDPPELLAHASSNLASALKQVGDAEAARELYRQALTIRESVYDAGDLRIAASLYALGSLDYEQGRLESALELLQRALESRRAAYGEQHTAVATVLSSLGRVHEARGELESAETLHRQALAIRHELLGEEHAHVALTRRDLASVLLSSGRLEEAHGLLNQALLSLKRARSPDDWTVASVESLQGAYLTRSGRFKEARPLLVQSLDTLRRVKGEHSPYTRQAADRLEALEQAQRKASTASS